MGRRRLNLLAALCCAGLMGYALYVQYVLLLDPCPLCVFQRIAVILLGTVFLIAGLHNAGGAGRIVYSVLIFAVAAGGAGVAGRHVWIQHLPPDRVPSCGPGFAYIIDSFPLADALKLIFTGSGECAKIDWQFLGLSMPAWVLIALVVLGSFGIWNNLRKD